MIFSVLLTISLVINGLFTRGANLGMRYHGNDNSIFLFFSAVYGLFWLISRGNTNVILGDAYMMENTANCTLGYISIETEFKVEIAFRNPCAQE